MGVLAAGAQPCPVVVLVCRFILYNITYLPVYSDTRRGKKSGRRKKFFLRIKRKRKKYSFTSRKEREVGATCRSLLRKRKKRKKVPPWRYRYVNITALHSPAVYPIRYVHWRYTGAGISIFSHLHYIHRWRVVSLLFIGPFFILHSIPWCYYQSTFDSHAAAAATRSRISLNPPWQRDAVEESDYINMSA